MKTCSICAQKLALTNFDIQKTGALGRRADCKSCRKRFLQSKTGMVKGIYSTQIAKSKKRKHPSPNYTEQELYDWVWKQPQAQQLYDAWVADNYSKKTKPSTDRLDDYQPYSLNNIRLITWQKHSQRYYQDAIAGINTKTCIAVDQFTLSGEFVQTYHSYKDAARAINGSFGNIRNVAEQTVITRTNPNGSKRSYILNSAHGFIWKKRQGAKNADVYTTRIFKN